MKKLVDKVIETEMLKDNNDFKNNKNREKFLRVIVVNKAIKAVKY